MIRLADLVRVVVRTCFDHTGVTRSLHVSLAFTKVGEAYGQAGNRQGPVSSSRLCSPQGRTFARRAVLGRTEERVWDRTEESDPLDEQISDYHWFLNAIRHWANTGEPVYRDAVKALEDGVWEFRHGDKRLTFFDTDGRGGFTAKLPIRRYADAEAPDSEYWQIPYFDRLIRIGHAFTKVSQKTLKQDLSESQEVRKEDLAHDRPTRSDVDR